MLSLSFGDFGYSVGYIPQVHSGGGVRCDSKGWTSRSVSGLSHFTNSVVADALTGFGFAITLTFRDCPETAAAMHKIRRKFIKRLQRRGLLRLLWLCEFQRRKVPHFHMAAYFETDKDALTGLPLNETIIRLWCECAAAYKVDASAQTCKNITDVGGWFGYLQKHIDRGLYHYQRQKETLPPEWREKTGQVWHWVGDWKRKTNKMHFSGKKFTVLFQFRDCEQKRQIANYRNELAKLSGSHFQFIGHRRHFYFSGSKIKKRYSRAWICHFIANRLSVVSDKYAERAADRANISLLQMPRYRRRKKRVFAPGKREQLEMSLYDYSASKRERIIRDKRRKLSALKGVRGAVGGTPHYVQQVLSYPRGFRDGFGNIRERDCYAT